MMIFPSLANVFRKRRRVKELRCSTAVFFVLRLPAERFDELNSHLNLSRSELWPVGSRRRILARSSPPLTVSNLRRVTRLVLGCRLLAML